MTREEVNQALNELCQYGGMMLGWKYVEAIKIAAIFYETGEDTVERNCANCGQPRNHTGDCILFMEGKCVERYEKWKPVTKEGECMEDFGEEIPKKKTFWIHDSEDKE